MLKLEFTIYRIVALCMVAGLLGSDRVPNTVKAAHGERKVVSGKDIDGYTFHDGSVAPNGILMSLALDAQAYQVGTEIIAVIRLKNATPVPVRLFIEPEGYGIINSSGVETLFVRNYGTIFHVIRYTDPITITGDSSHDLILRFEASIPGLYRLQTHETIREENSNTTHDLVSPAVSFTITN